LSALLELLLLLLLRQVVSDDATGRGAHNAVMPGQVSCNTSDYGSFDTAFRLRSG
jgi:hypothetical protein